MSQLCIELKPLSVGNFLGTRRVASGLRASVASELEKGEGVLIDFTGISVTQGFVDELIGNVVLQMGPEVMGSITLKGCTDEVKEIVRFVVTDRAMQFRKSFTEKHDRE